MPPRVKVRGKVLLCDDHALVRGHQAVAGRRTDIEVVGKL